MKKFLENVKMIRIGTLCFMVIFVLGVLQSCKNNEPSIIKVFVRSSSNVLLEGVQVVIVGDQNANPPSIAFVDTSYTNGSGFATFNMDTYYTLMGESNEVGYFTIFAKEDTKSGEGYIRSRAHTTAVETVFLSN